MKQLPTNSIHLVRYLNEFGPKTQKQLKQELNLSFRALRYALNKLEISGMINKKHNLADMRSPFYVVNSDILPSQNIIQDSTSWTDIADVAV